MDAARGGCTTPEYAVVSLFFCAGTLNTEDFLECPNTVLSDIEAKRFVGGAALQWAGKYMVERVAQTWPVRICVRVRACACWPGRQAASPRLAR